MRPVVQGRNMPMLPAGRGLSGRGRRMSGTLNGALRRCSRGSRDVDHEGETTSGVWSPYGGLAPKNDLLPDCSPRERAWEESASMAESARDGHRVRPSARLVGQPGTGLEGPPGERQAVGIRDGYLLSSQGGT